MSKCTLCPRECNVDREISLGYCEMSSAVRIAGASLHMWEEPPISGKRGSGTIFFCGCSLGCIFCQNKAISHDGGRDVGRSVSNKELISLIYRLAEEGAHNINFVTPTHFADTIAEILPEVRKNISIPIVYNCGGYEKVETLRMLDGLVDIYLPDFKYFSDSLAKKYSAAPNYCKVAVAAIKEMYRQVGRAEFSDGLMKKGMIIRHLVLPGCRRDSADVLRVIAESLPIEDIRISIMRQYTPEFAPTGIDSLSRKVTSFEYDFVLSEAEKYGFDGYFQDKTSATSNYTPDFQNLPF